MRYLMMVKVYDEAQACAPRNPELDEAIRRLTEGLAKSGVIETVGGLLTSETGAVVKASGGKLTVIDGPFTEAKEIIGGFAILNCASKEEAIERGRTFMQLHADFLGPSYQGELEIRQMA